MRTLVRNAIEVCLQRFRVSRRSHSEHLFTIWDGTLIAMYSFHFIHVIIFSKDCTFVIHSFTSHGGYCQ